MNKRVKLWLAVSLFIAGILSLFASSHPDGFEKAGEETGFIGTATAYLSSPLPDYSLPNVESWISGSLSGIIGVLVTYFLFLGFGRLIGSKAK